MKVTLKECLALEEFKNARLLSGEQHLNSPLKSISILDVADKQRIKEYIAEKDTLLLSGFFATDWSLAEQKEIGD